MASGQAAHWLLSLSLGSSVARRGSAVSRWRAGRWPCPSFSVAGISTSSATPHSSDAPAAATPPLIKKLLVANRGEIACRVLTTARKLGVPSVAVYSEADRAAKHVGLADEAYCIGGAAARDSYLRTDAILDVARRTGATAVHPGYGFLSENAGFAEACAAAGVAFVGPPPDAIRAMGDKAKAKAIMSAAGVPVVPGYHGDDQSEERLVSEAQRVGFPLLVKAVSGGGGKGMKLAAGPEDLRDAIRSARREALASFGDDRVILERYVQRPRHVEVQVFADRHGDAVYLFDRDCSLQRRHQKVIEEAPAPGLPDAFHRSIGEAAVRAAQAVGYVNAGTVEFIVDTDSGGEFFFMEMNTRLQVEHPVTEAITGQDLVAWQLAVAAGARLPLDQAGLAAEAARHGHAFEARIYAESPRNNFLPGAGTVRRWRTPAAATFENAPLRVDSGVREGDSVGTFYDPMIAKLVASGPSREEALARLVAGLRETQVGGLPTNVPFLIRLATHPAFAAASPEELTTAFIGRHREALLAPQPLSSEVAALAAVARHLLRVRSAAEAEAAAGLAGRLGPWGGAAPSSGGAGGPAGGDSWRGWHRHARSFLLRHPEGGEGAAVRATLTVLGGGDFTVHTEMLSGAAAAEADKAPAPAAPTAPHPTAPAVSVRCATLTSADTLVAEVGGRRCTANVLMYGSGGGSGAPVEEALDLWLEGEHYHFTWSEPTWSRKAGAGGAAGAGGRVAAPMPGRVVAVLAAEGDVVKAGTPLVALEAMKMEHSVVSPSAGRVAEVLVGPGAQVAQGQPLVVVEPEGGGACGKGDGKAGGEKKAK
ncbi:hypothetical protein HYH03_000401 [Edaphochlamys debaryana]|uniref:Uncharacterized protein n=1 Tax=Edaphochlamys debaryana TaxID=47281 RepID=A0A835YFS0_9CHLO|nr:hypothetical protein HYH03_000401 [Edaphochlamys debaryana]|eukprot:KAG2501903.1 hypothetical protein HYH03_000401 [Edaphochlamys debaryana]